MSKSWDYITVISVCVCCMLAHANGECCDSDSHGGDGMVPLSLISPTDSVAMGIPEDEHRQHCSPADREADRCDCEHDTFMTSQCEGCGSWLAGERYKLSLFVNDRPAVEV